MALILVVAAAGFLVEFLSGGEVVESSLYGYAWDEQLVEDGGPEKIVQLFVNGVISAEPEAAGLPSMVDRLKDQLLQAEQDELVAGIVLRIESPGGEVVATDEIYRKLMELKEKRGIPIVVSMGSTAASGGYYLATAGDAIFANPNTITGSLGVIFSLPNYAEAADRFGVRQYVIKSGKFKDIGNPLRDLAPEERSIFQTLVNESYARFVDVIVKGRNLPRQRVLEIADGRIYSGQQAKRLQLIDEFGDLEEATAYARDMAGVPDASVVRYTEVFSLESLLFGLQKKVWQNSSFSLGKYLETDSSPKLMYLFSP